MIVSVRNGALIKNRTFEVKFDRISHHFVSIAIPIPTPITQTDRQKF